MAYTDKTLQCSDCSQSFTFTASEQELFANKGYTNEPKRCPACRSARRAERGDSAPRSDYRSGGYQGGSRQMFPATCATCGKQTQVPFEPRTGRPVYCSECYSKTRR